jgi:hypothetical protein
MRFICHICLILIIVEVRANTVQRFEAVDFLQQYLHLTDEYQQTENEATQ